MKYVASLIVHLLAAAQSQSPSPAEKSLALVSGVCWEEALDFFHGKNLQRLKFSMNGGDDLQTRRPDRDDPCKHFSDPDKKMMAIIMTECHSRSRQKGGGPKSMLNQIWDKDQSEEFENFYQTFVENKLSTFSDLSFHLYLNFYNHLESICFQVQSSLWQTRTDDLIHALSETAGVVASQVEYSARLNSELLENQELSITQQQKMMSDSIRLKQAIEGGQARLQDAFDDIRDEVEHERRRFQEVFKDLFDAFQKVLAFQKYLKSRLFDMHTAFFYAFLLFVSHYITATPRTAHCRPQLYLIWSGMAIGELILSRVAGRIRASMEISFFLYKPFLGILWNIICLSTQGSDCGSILSYTSPSQIWPCLEDETTTRHRLIASLRLACAALAATNWFYAFLTYTDPQLKNLRTVTDHIAKLHSRLEENLMGMKECQEYDSTDPVSKLLDVPKLTNTTRHWTQAKNDHKSKPPPSQDKYATAPPPSRFKELLQSNPQARLLLAQEKSTDFQARLYSNALTSRIISVERL